MEPNEQSQPHEGEIFQRIVKEHANGQVAARKIGVTRNTITNWYKRETLTIEMWEKIAHGLEVDPRNFVPRLKNYPQSQLFGIYSEEAKEYLHDVARFQEIVERKDQQIADKDLIIRSLEQRIADQQELIRSQRETIDALTDKD